MNKPTPYLTEEDYKKAIGQLRLALNGAVRLIVDIDGVHYGLRDNAIQAIEVIVKLSEDFGLRLRGVDKPISYEYATRRKRGRK